MISRKNQLFEIFIALLALLSVTLICIEYLVPLSSGQLTLIYIADLAICVVFGVDFALRFRSAENRKVFLKEHWYEMLAMIPAYMFVLLQFQIIFGALARSIRLIRVIRLVFMLARLRRAFRISSNVLQQSYIVYLLIICLVTVFIGGFGAFIIENDAPNALIKTFGDALWWSLSTVTTVGYGDIVPSTFVGRVIGVILMFVGISLVGVFISALGAVFTEKRLGKNLSNITLDESMFQIVQNRLKQPEKLSGREIELLESLTGFFRKMPSTTEND
ncbi:ion transporter [Chloroflexota bacterium]